MRIIITGGHLTPALAVIEELQKGFGKDLQILFIGRKYPLEGDPAISWEYQVITQRGIPFVSLTAGRLQRKFTRYTIPSLLKAPLGFLQALGWLIKFKPDAILSFGGYIALPVVLAGWLSRVPVVTHEQTPVSGLANKIIARFSQKICLSWPQSVKLFPKEKVVLTGNPVRKEIFKVQKSSQFPVPSSQFPLIYITGGSLGSHVINEAVSEILPQLLEKYDLIHQCGDSQKYQDYEKLKIKSAKLKVDLQKRYFLTRFVGPADIGWVLDRADLVVGRAGANTVCEIAALGKPAIFIPIPWSEGREQIKNAQILVDLGMAVILPQEKLNGENLYQIITQMMANLKEYKDNAPRVQKLVNLGAAEKIVEVINEMVGKKKT